MRTHGPVDTPGSIGLSGHACWSYVEPADLVGAAAAFLQEGERLGQRLMFVGGAATEQMVRETEPLASRVADGTLHLYGERDGLALSGEVDVFTAEVLELLLVSGDGAGDEVLDVSDLSFIDHAAMHVIRDHGRRLEVEGRRLVVRGGTRAFGRVAELVDGVGAC